MNKQSSIWNFLENNSSTTAICKISKKELKRSNNTSNLREYLKKKHAGVYETGIVPLHTRADFEITESFDSMVRKTPKDCNSKDNQSMASTITSVPLPWSMSSSIFSKYLIQFLQCKSKDLF